MRIRCGPAWLRMARSLYAYVHKAACTAVGLIMVRLAFYDIIKLS
jgi:hypothetical protein